MCKSVMMNNYDGGRACGRRLIYKSSRKRKTTTTKKKQEKIACLVMYMGAIMIPTFLKNSLGKTTMMIPDSLILGFLNRETHVHH